MRKFLIAFLGLALVFHLSTAASAQTVETDTMAQVGTSGSTTTYYSDDRFVTARANAGLTGDTDVRFRSVYNREWAEVGPLFTNADMAIRRELQPNQVGLYNQIMTDSTRFQLLRMTPAQYQDFRSTLGSRLMLTSSQQSAVYPLLDRAVAQASYIHRANYAPQYCQILGMERHESFDREVASVEIFQERVAERRVDVSREAVIEVRREAVVETDTDFMRDRDLK